MDNRTKALVGSWIQAVGTTMSAISNTSLTIREEAFSSYLDLWGNVLQGTGNALVADSEEELSLDKWGNKIQSTGNLVNVVGFLADVSEEVETELNIKGNLIQSAGGSLSFADALNEDLTESSFYDIYGNLLQIIGNSMQGIAGIKELKSADGELINTIGGWIQAVGSILTLISTIKNV
ncbi:DUF6944 family repetitive protein [Virgibacillus halodenitrificans]|uniref:DUF6944 family repetitive protein n=1 Tax=Virgibacillus halodenitrificans TaxID=1482 RepID=UPI001F2E8C4C|nr:hypothetical protein [Virgibacillus halodenitrificans]